MRKATTRRTDFCLFFLSTLLCFSLVIKTSKAITLLDGRYQTSNDVTAYLNLALDIAKMNEADDFDTLLDIYKNVSIGIIDNIVFVVDDDDDLNIIKRFLQQHNFLVYSEFFNI